MRVQICNERFLLRFGVDRILTILGQHLAGQGFDVSFVCLRGDRDALARITPDIEEIRLPPRLDLIGSDHYSSDVVATGWATERPDVLVIGGWPFFGAAASARAAGLRSIFIDAGAVPHDNLPAEALGAQRQLRRLRERSLPTIDRVLPISDFIRYSQTEPDRGRSDGVETVLLGADHLSARRFGPAILTPADREALDRLEGLIAQGRKLILLAGRFEAAGYKNSAAVFPVFRSIRAQVPDTHLVVLGGSDPVAVPPELAETTTVLGTIGDEALRQVMERSSVGLSLSLWEGFNLPIAEMQHCDRPMLAFAVGAHPEVIADPWLLCSSEAEMASKACKLLADGMPPEIRARNPFEAFRRRSGWDSPLDCWTRSIESAAQDRTVPQPEEGRRLVLVDVTNSAKDPANSGVVRVTRRLTAQLSRQRSLDVVPVTWDGERCRYTLVDPSQSFLSSNSGPLNWIGATAASCGEWVSIEQILRAADPRSAKAPLLFLPEVILDGSVEERVTWAAARHLETAFILFDLLPIFEADLVDPKIAAVFESYLQAVASSGLIIAISDFTRSEFLRYCAQRGLRPASKVEAIWLPGQFSDHERVEAATTESLGLINVLCVSTIEPRKNHRSLVEAFRAVRRRLPDLDLRLDLVGNRYAGADDLAAWLERMTTEDDRIVWHGILPDAEVASRYNSAAFTVYPSLAEGFGLPILESLWMGRPCICHETGVMRELAADGGCLPVDASNVAELAAAIEELATNETLRSVLTSQALRRPIDTWEDYGHAVASRLQARRPL